MTVKDRYPELTRVLGVTTNNDIVEVELPNNDDIKLQEIFMEVGKLRKWIDEINEKTLIMKRLYSESTYQVSKTMQDDMDTNMTISTANGIKVCGALKELEEKTKSIDDNSVISRIIQLQYASLHHLYIDALSNNEAFLSKYKESRLALLQRQIKLTHQSISEDECHSLIESNQLSIFVDCIEENSKEARLALQDVENRHRELLKVENSLKEVRNMFVQMAMLVQQQQSLIDTVEYFASRATDYVESGNKQLHEGVVNKTKARKKKKLLIICLIAGVTIILLIVFLT